MRRGVVCIGTGTYSQFVPALEANIADLGAADVMFCLTDDADLLRRPHSKRSGLEALRLPWGRLPWPMPTLFRYHAMRAYAPVFREHVTHLLYCDVDMRVVRDIRGLFVDSVVAVAHPGTTQQDGRPYPYESNRSSRAFFEVGPCATYVAGGVQGGPVDEYLAAVEDCAQAVTADHLAGITARWHDESHWNRYVNTTESVRIVGADYCWPETWQVPSHMPLPRILALDKEHHALRGTRPSAREVLERRLAHVPLARRTVRAARALRR